MIQILCADVSQLNETQYRQLYGAASDARKARADRCRDRWTAACCLGAEALLRFALTERFGTAVGFCLTQTPLGKPYFENAPDFHFSLSHSGGYAAIAYSDSNVGLDLERIDTGRDLARLARRYFAGDEQTWLRDMAPERFYDLWTAKESYLKYLGTGLTRSPASFSVLEPDALGVVFQWETVADCRLCLCGAQRAYRLRRLEIGQLLEV